MSAQGEAIFKSSIDFPDPHLTLAEGIVAVGGRLDVGTLYHAYTKGIFPWPHPEYPLLWFSPEKRGVLEFDKLHIPKSLRKFLRQRSGEFQVTQNRCFARVIEACEKQFRPGQDGTWILPEMKAAYLDFHIAGYAHSFEVWQGSRLVGGLYGVLVKGVFSGESMFHKVDNASKIALLAAIDFLMKNGHAWMDIQMVTPVLGALGAVYWERDYFLDRLHERQLQSGY